MPRPDKQINPGSLDGPETSSRAKTWTKYGGAETAEGHRGAPSSPDSIVVEVTVDDITVTDYPDDSDTKYMTRGTSAHDAVLPGDQSAAKTFEIVTEWVIERSVNGRRYHRLDRLIDVQLEV